MVNWSTYVAGFVLLLAIACATPETSKAQEFNREVDASGVSYHTFVEPGEPSIRILVVGPGAGVYDVGLGTRIDELFALSGVGELSGQSSRERRRTTLTLYREEGARRVVIYEAAAEEMVAEPNAYPTLQEGDVLVVESVTRTRFSWRDTLQIITALSSIAILIWRIQRL